MACNIDTLTIVDTTSKAAPAQISRTPTRAWPSPTRAG